MLISSSSQVLWQSLHRLKIVAHLLYIVPVAVHQQTG